MSPLIMVDHNKRKAAQDEVVESGYHVTDDRNAGARRASGVLAMWILCLSVGIRAKFAKFKDAKESEHAKGMQDFRVAGRVLDQAKVALQRATAEHERAKTAHSKTNAVLWEHRLQLKRHTSAIEHLEIILSSSQRDRSKLMMEASSHFDVMQACELAAHFSEPDMDTCDRETSAVILVKRIEKACKVVGCNVGEEQPCSNKLCCVRSLGMLMELLRLCINIGGQVISHIVGVMLCVYKEAAPVDGLHTLFDDGRKMCLSSPTGEKLPDKIRAFLEALVELARQKIMKIGELTNLMKDIQDAQ